MTLCESCLIGGIEREATTQSTNPGFAGYELCAECAAEYDSRPKEQSHTPEPWEVIVTENSIETTVCGPIKVKHRRTLGVSDLERKENIAAMEAEAMANASLIAAAPDLLEACEAIAKYRGDLVMASSDLQYALRKVEDAIAKAT